MEKIKIRLPATITNLGPGLQSLALAVGLYTTVEISGRNDEQLNVEISGEGADSAIAPYRHPVVRMMSRFFQRVERAVPGFNVRISNDIPLKSGLGAEAAFALAGVIGANNLLNSIYKRDQVLEFAASIDRADAVVSALMGGLAVGVLDEDETLIRCALPVAGLRVVVVVPQITGYRPPLLPEGVPRRDAMFNLRRVPLLVEALRTGDLDLLARVIDDRLYSPRLTEGITGYGHVMQVARRSGALAVTPCGDGPSLIAFAKDDLDYIAEDMVAAFKGAGVDARAWVLPVDTQGVVISAVQMAS